MDAGRWRRIRDLFDIVAGEPRDRWLSCLEAASPGRGDLHAEVINLLEADLAQASLDGKSTGLIGRAPDLLGEIADRDDARQADAWVGQRLGAWSVKRPIGRGGMGMVYLAERADGEFTQQVAIKLMRPGADSEAVIQRFRSERQILAGLEHPNIAHLIDGGVTADGVPWFALEFVDGCALTAWCDAQAMPVRDRLTMFLSVCAAVSHAHGRLIVHRDLKPANILVDGSGQVKLLDFGIAKLLDPAQVSAETGTVFQVFTPEYAAPEQIRGDPMTTAVDVYALGLVLFELLTGRGPYRLGNMTSGALMQAILTQEPVRLSSAVVQPAKTDQAASTPVEALAQRRGASPARLRAQLRGDLDAIVSKALRKEPSQRYGSVLDLAGDIRAVLNHRPVAARQGGWRYRSRRFLRRYAVEVGFATLASVALIGGLIAALWQAEVAERARSVAQDEANKARAVSGFLVNLFTSSDPTQTDGHDPRASELLEKGVREIEAQPDLGDATRAALLTSMGSAYLSLMKADRGLDLMRKADQAARAGGDLRIQLDSAMTLGRALINTGESEQGLHAMQRVQSLYDQLGIDQSDIQVKIDTICGIALANLSRPAEALTYLQRAFDQLNAEARGSDELGRVMEIYIQVLLDLGRTDDAVAIAEAAYDSARSVPDLPLVRLENFAAAAGAAFLMSGRPEDAEQRFRHAVETSEAVFGKGQPGTTTALHNLSVAIRNQGRYPEAAAISQQVLNIRRAHSSSEHDEIARAEMNLGILHSLSGDDALAMPLLVSGMNGLERSSSDRGAVYAYAKLALVRSLERTGEYAEALAISRELEPQRQGKHARISGNRAIEFDLMRMRLHIRLGQPLTDCPALMSVVDAGQATQAQRAEAIILMAHCDWQGGRTEQAASHLADPLVSSGADLEAVNPFSRELLASMRP